MSLRTKKYVALGAIIVSGLTGRYPLMGQQSGAAQVDANSTVAAASHVVDQSELGDTYRIGPGDVLHVSVWQEDALTQNAVVRTDGKISLPLVSEVLVAGKTPLNVQQMLTKSYSAFIARPEVTVTITEVNSQIVYILGEVQKPGAYPFVQSMNLLQLVARAGGFTPYAKKHSIYLLQGTDHKRITVNLDKLLKGEGPDATMAVVSGDTVFVP